MGARIAITGYGRQGVRFVADSQQRDTRSPPRACASTLQMRERAASYAVSTKKWAINAMQRLRHTAKACRWWASNNYIDQSSKAAQESKRYAATMPESTSPKLQALWCAGHRVSVRVYKAMCRLFADTTMREHDPRSGSNKQRWSLRSGQSTVCNKASTDEQPPKYRAYFIKCWHIYFAPLVKSLQYWNYLSLCSIKKTNSGANNRASEAMLIHRPGRLPSSDARPQACGA